jgi:hypothetical protein
MKPNELKVYVPLKLCFIFMQKVKRGSRLNYLLILLFKEGLATADSHERLKKVIRGHTNTL